jgi:hypothetical protein
MKPDGYVFRARSELVVASEQRPELIAAIERAGFSQRDVDRFLFCYSAKGWHIAGLSHHHWRRRENIYDEGEHPAWRQAGVERGHLANLPWKEIHAEIVHSLLGECAKIEEARWAERVADARGYVDEEDPR